RISLISAAFSAAVLLCAAHAGAQSPAPGGRLKVERFKGREVVAGQVLVKFGASAQAQEIERAKVDADVEHERRVGTRGVRLLQSRSKNVEALVRELSARRDVVYAEPNYVIRVNAVPDDARFGEQWALLNTGQTVGAGAATPGADVGVVSAWDITTGSRANVVAVVDTGIDYNHPDLAANVWSAPAPFTVNIAGQTITCAAGSHGFDALTNTCDPLDDHNHGTHVAGIVGAAGNNSLGVSGVSQTASIMGLRFLDAQGNGTLEGAINAIEFAVQAKQIFGAGANVRVLSNSWGWTGDASQALLEAINSAAASDMLFVAGAGNDAADTDAAPFYPASYDAASVVSVAATDANDGLARTSSWGSNYGRNTVDLGAPGDLILSTVIGGSYDWFGGTSMATPHVSGAAALVLSRCTLDTAGLKSALLGGVDPVASLAGVTATGGRLNVSKALGSCSGATPMPTPTATPTPAPNGSPTVTLTSPAGGTTFTAPANITLGATASDADGVISRVDFYAGAQLVGTSYAEPHAFNWSNVAGGAYTLTAVAADDRGVTATSAPVNIFVNRPPTASAGGPYSGQAGRAVQFNGGGSSDSDGTIISYRWEFGDGTTGAGASPSHVYTTARTYDVLLTVTDDRGATATARTTVTIAASPSGTAGGTGTTNRLPKWLDGVGTLGDSLISESGGFVGIGTASPTTPLEVIYNNNGFGFGFNIKNSNTGTQALTGYGINNAADQRVGQFVFVPSNYTNAALRDTLLFSSAGPTTALGFVSSADGAGTPDIFFRAGGTKPDAMRIKGESGNVGIGTANPQSALQVNGYIQLSTVTAAPPAADCDAAAEMGRMKVDPTGFKLYVCTSAGWKAAVLQ
ncbi:MAG TPA: S8 family serine peptidase, partial [Pyrinomonadaceae bacterium]